MKKKVRIKIFINLIKSFYNKKGNKFNDVKDLFDRLKFKLNEKIKKCEVLLDEKDKLYDATSNQEVFKRKKLEKNIENLIDEIHSDLKELEVELKAQKKKPKKYQNIETKEEILGLLKKKRQMLRYRFDNNEVKEEEIEENKTALEKLEALLESKKNKENKNVDRDLYDEEIDKMNEWKDRVKKQDEELDVVHEGVKALKHELIEAGEGMDEINRKVKKTNKKMNKTHKKVVTQNQKLKDLAYKLRSADKLCCDIILIMILLGLIGVLYGIIKQKY